MSQQTRRAKYARWDSANGKWHHAKSPHMSEKECTYHLKKWDRWERMKKHKEAK